MDGAASEDKERRVSQLVVVGSSAGGVEALSTLVASLSSDFPAPVVIAQHIDPGEERLEKVIEEDFSEQAGNGRVEDVTVYTCPACGGVMWQAEAGPPLRFRCHVGHAYVPELLLSQKSEEVEAALWSCVRLLREKATLTRQLATRTRATNGGEAARIEDQAELDERHAQVLRELLEAIPNPVDQAAAIVQALDQSVPGGNGQTGAERPRAQG